MRFHSLPRVPHLPSSRRGNDDLEVPESELPLFFASPVVIVEKLDGVGLTVALDPGGGVDVDMKREWREALDGRILRAARRWVRVHEDLLEPLVRDGSHLYGEWLLHRLVLRYDSLPAALVFHGIRDRRGRQQPRDEGNARVKERGLAVVEPHFRGVIGQQSLGSLVKNPSQFSRGRAEGIIVEAIDRQGARWAKWVSRRYRQPKGREIELRTNTIR
ncbi:MAG: hypothetical protein HY791_20615 [Deltaproteobacteria bacterium]|nr:hypothetical protein [Deltaproteobacteria bacterium]